VHSPHPPPPISHPPGNIASIASPPTTPSSARLNAASSAFVPGQPRKQIQIKSADGKEIDIAALTKSSAAPSNATSSGQASPYRQSSPAVPATPKRASVRLESEDQRRERLAKKEKEEEELRAQQEKDAKAKKDKEEEEAQKKKAQQEKEEQERARVVKEKEDAERLRKEEEERKKAEEAREKKEAEEKVLAAKREAEDKAKREAQAAEQAKKDAEAKALKDKEDKERKEKEEKERKEREDKERESKEQADRKAKEEAERAAKEEADSKAKEEAELKVKEDAASKAKAEEAASAAAKADSEKADAKAAASAVEEGEITEEPSQVTAKESLRINTSTSNPADLGKRRPHNLDFTGLKSTPIASALSTARHIETLDAIKYPEGIQSPRPELNENSKPGRFRYDRDFLLQFREICKDKPPNMPPLDAIGLEPVDPSLMMARGGSGRHRGASGAPSRQGSMGPPFGGPGLGKPGAFSGMGNFTTPNRMSSEDRFMMSNNRSASATGGPMPFGRTASMTRTASTGGPGPHGGRTRSKRGEKRPAAEGKGQDRYSQHSQPLSLEPVAPLQATENRWDRKSVTKATEADQTLIVDRKVKGLLNKLTMEKFESISNQIIEWANKSESETDGRTLIQVIRLVFEKATDEAAWSEMYARLCRKMMEQISPKVQDDGIRNNEGKPIAGGQLFRKYLLNRCQEDFERGWVQKEATAAAAKAKAADDAAVASSNAASAAAAEGAKKDDEIALYSDEYYASQKAKRQGLGLVKFIGELFKLQMLTERIMHECVKKLLGNVNNPEEEEIESLCKLLITVGAQLDTPKAHAHMDIYFSRMKELTKSPNVSSRMQYLLQDVIELRERKWIARNLVAAPTTIAQVHQAAAKEKAANEKESLQRQMGMSRTSSNRGRGRNAEFEQGPDGWAVAGNQRPVPSKAGDLSQFGKINKQQPMMFGPASVFNKKDKRESLSRSSSSSNMFAMLNADTSSEPKPEPVERKRLVLQPRSVPAEGDAEGAAASEDAKDGAEGEAAAPVATGPPEMSGADAKKKIAEDTKELFGVRSLDEAEVYFTTLPPAHHPELVETLVNRAVESKMADAELVASFFERAMSKNLATPDDLEKGLLPTAEFIEDIAIDAPLAYQLFAKMVKGAKLSEEAHSRIAAKDGSGKLAGHLSS